MVYASRGALAAIAVFLTQMSSGDAQVGRTFHVHQEPDPNKQLDIAPTTLNDIATAGKMAQQCVNAANPNKDKLKEGDTVFIPLTCCEASGSCAAPFCDHRDACTTAVAPAKASLTTGSANTTGQFKRAEGTGRPYLVSTVDGVTQEQYEAFALQPPLNGRQGDIMAEQYVPWVSCQYLDLTDEDAAVIRMNPMIQFVEPITEDNGEAIVIPPTLRKRALPQSLNQRDESVYHLGLIAARNQKNDPTKLPSYVFEPSLGKGQTIYVIDSGYRKTHTEFDASQREVRDFAVSNRFTLDPILPPIPNELQAPRDMTDINGHGTMVASIAAGYTYGVASLANLVVVKFRNSAKNPNNPSNPDFLPRGVTDAALEAAFRFVFGDVGNQRAQNPDPNARFIINLSYGWIKEEHTGKIRIMERLLARCKSMDITIVVAAGNDGGIRALDELVPQEFGTDDRFSMITVGGVDKEGKYYRDTINSRGQGGEINLYAGAVGITAAAYNQQDDSTIVATGTSVSAPAVAGLAAYFFGIPELSSNWHDGSVPGDIKAFLMKNSEVRNDNPFNEGDTFPVSPKPDAATLKVPYNLALDELCSISDAAAKRSFFSRRALDPFKSVPGRPIVENGAVTNNNLKDEICNIHNANSNPPPEPTTTNPPAPTATPEPEPAPEPAPEPTPEPAPAPHTAACKVLEQGLGGGKWEVDGSGWGDEGSLKAKFGDDSFAFSGGDPWTASFVSEMSAGDIENAVKDMSGVADVKCT